MHFFNATVGVTSRGFNGVMFEVPTPRLWLALSAETWKMILFGSMSLLGLAAVVGGLYLLARTGQLTVKKTGADAAKVSSQSATAASSQAATDAAASKSAVGDDSAGSASMTDRLNHIYIDISGAVVKPGLYVLDREARVAELIEQAGGFTEEADVRYVTQELNLAEKLTDGQKIYIWTTAEMFYQSQLADQAVASSASAVSSSAMAGQISINSATSQELETLAGIGEKRAEDIIGHRPYVQIEDLVTQKIVTEKIFNEIKAQLSL